MKGARDRLVKPGPIQSAIRVGARSGVLPRRIYSRLPVHGAHPVTTPGGNVVTYVADDRDMMARAVVWENLRRWEAGTLRMFSALVRGSDLVLDVGAYSGIYSIVACADGARHVVAFEPNPATVPLLERNIATNGLQDRVEVIARGASNRPGLARMMIPLDRTAARVAESGDGPEIELTTIDEVVAGRKVEVVKVDVEGLEPEVLRGGAETLSRHRPAIIAEALDAPSFDRINEVARELGYDTCEHLGPRGAVRTDHYVHAPPHANFLWRV